MIESHVSRRNLSLLALAASAVAVGAASVVAPASGAADVAVAPGKPAPDFTARDSKGREVKLSSFKGKVVVLEWTNNGCPYVAKHYGAGAMQALQKDVTGQDVVWLSIISSAPGQQGHAHGLEADKIAADAKANPSAILLDPEGAVGRLYKAQTTPHMFVIDKAGTLAYMGAIDDKPTSNPADLKGARNYVREAVAAVQGGKPVAVASTRAYGCSVKYKS